jgi:hypothetical protein
MTKQMLNSAMGKGANMLVVTPWQRRACLLTIISTVLFAYGLSTETLWGIISLYPQTGLLYWGGFQISAGFTLIGFIATPKPE